MQDIKTISFEGCKYNWDDVDNDATRLNMNRSQFLQFLYWDFKKKKKHNVRYTDVAILVLLAICTLCVMFIMWR